MPKKKNSKRIQNLGEHYTPKEKPPKNVGSGRGRKRALSRSLEESLDLVKRHRSGTISNTTEMTLDLDPIEDRNDIEADITEDPFNRPLSHSHPPESDINEAHVNDIQAKSNDDEIATGWGPDVGDDEPAGDGLDEADGQRECSRRERKTFDFAPELKRCRAALQPMMDLLRPPRADRTGYKKNKLSPMTEAWLGDMKTFLEHYIGLEEEEEGKRGNWTAVGKNLMKPRKLGGHGWSQHRARMTKKWTRAFVEDHDFLPTDEFGKTRSLIDDEDLCQEIKLHLQEKGKFLKAEDICRYLAQPEMLERLKRTKTITVQTARLWLIRMGYRWVRDFRGQYVDGHERADVIDYRQNVFLPRVKELLASMREWSNDGEEIPREVIGEVQDCFRWITVWFHDESVFYGHDQRKSQWVAQGEGAAPYAKGEGASIMVADFVSADWGWLKSPDGKETVRVVFKPGKERDGYFDNDDIVKQAHKAMDLLQKHYSEDKHVLVFDNATTHLKRPANALSATNMTKKPSANFGPTVPDLDEKGNKKMHDGKVVMKRIRMEDTVWNGKVQSLYFPDDHPEFPGQFKGMTILLQERGYPPSVEKLKVQCGKTWGNCPDEGKTECCQRRIMYNQPDFVTVESLLERECQKRGFEVLFLPKFHCELNFIEQCWGYAKRQYRLMPRTKTEEEMEKHVLAALDSVPLVSMRRFANRSLRFMHFYRMGCSGSQAAYAARKFRGHRMPPSEAVWKEIERMTPVVPDV